MSINLYYNQVLILQGPAPETRRRESRAPRAPRHRRGDCSIQRFAGSRVLWEPRKGVGQGPPQRHILHLVDGVRVVFKFTSMHFLDFLVHGPLDLGPAVRRTGRRVLRTKSRVLSNSSLSDIFSHAHASYLVATSFNYCRGQSDYGSPRDPPATKKNYLATRFNECAPPCTRCSSSEGDSKPALKHGFSAQIDRRTCRRTRTGFASTSLQLTARCCGKELRSKNPRAERGAANFGACALTSLFSARAADA